MRKLSSKKKGPIDMKKSAVKQSASVLKESLSQEISLVFLEKSPSTQTEPHYSQKEPFRQKEPNFPGEKLFFVKKALLFLKKALHKRNPIFLFCTRVPSQRAVFLRALERKSSIFKGSFCRKIVFLLGSFDKESYLLRALV